MRTRHFAFQGLGTALVFLGLATFSHADVYETPPAPRPIASSSDKDISPTVAPGRDGRLQVAPASETPPPANPYLLKAAPRAPLSGYAVSVFAGANVSQEDDITTFGGTPVTGNTSEVAPMGGIKFGYVWPFNDEPIDQFEMETASVGGVRVSGGLELEAFYVGNTSKVTNATGTTDFDMDMGFLMVNATLQAQWGDFRLFAGPGVGLAVVGTDDDTTAGLAYEVMGGLDYFITPDWSIFGEYKYLIIDHLSLSTPAGTADFGDQFGQHIVSMGVRKHF